MSDPYKPILSKRLLLFQESQTIAMAKAGRALAAAGKPVINLSFGEPDFRTPDYIGDAAKEAIDKGYTKYTPVAGIPELKAAIVHKFKRDNDLNYQSNQIVVSTGAKNAIMNTIMAILNDGDEVLIPTPYWVSYSDMVKLAGGKPVFIEAGMSQDFKITAKQLLEAIGPNTKLFIFSSPSNPTGSIYSKEELADLVSVFAKHPKIFILSDEIYEHINYQGKHHSIASFKEVYERTITINGLSKGFAMTGWRLGYLAAHEDIAFACEKIQGQFTSGTNSITQRAAITALGDDLTETYKMRDIFLERRNLMLSYLQKIPGIKINKPPGAFYLFPDISYYFGMSYQGKTINSAMDLCMYLLENHHVTLVSGEAFGAPNYIRISYAASSKELVEACERIIKALALLK